MFDKAIRLIFLFILITASAFSQNQWPTNGWLMVKPDQVGLIADSLASFDNELSSGKYGNIDGMLVIRYGKIAYEKSYEHNYADIYKEEGKTRSLLNAKDFTGPYNYFNPWWHPFFHNTNLHTLQSVTKTVTSVVIGTALARNQFPDLNTPVLKFFDTSLVKNIDDRKRKMTIHDLLTMTAGFNWNENLPYTDTNNTGGMMEASCDWVKYTIDRPMADVPGTVFNYNSGATLILAHIFNVSTGMDIEEYATKYLFEPLGIKNYYWKRSSSGLLDTEGGLYLHMRDIAKIFFLYLKDGKWEDRQIVKPDWIKQSLTPKMTVAPGVSYGFKWWLYNYGATDSKLAAAGAGFGGQRPIMIREYDIIVVFTGWNITPGKHYLEAEVAIEKVLHSIKGYKKTNEN